MTDALGTKSTVTREGRAIRKPVNEPRDLKMYLQRSLFMKKERRFSHILLYQGIGFFAIMFLCWADLVFDVQALILQEYSGWARPLWSCLLQTLLVMTVWFLVSTSTRRVWERLHSLEEFLRVCSWCRRIDYKGDWIPIEDYLNQTYDTPTTHGICEECMREQIASMRESQKKGEDGASAVPMTDKREG